MSIITEPLPLKTVKGRLSDHFALVSGMSDSSLHPQMVQIYDSGLVCLWDNYLTLNDREEGKLLEVWPKGSLKQNPEERIKIKVLLTESGPVVYDFNAERLVWIYPVNLSERISLNLKSVDTDHDLTKLKMQSFTADNNGKVLLSMSGEDSADSLLLLISPEAEVKSVLATDDEALNDLALIKEGLLCLSDTELSFICGESVFSEAEKVPKDKLWCSPDGRFVITTGKNSERVTLHRILPGDEEPVKELLEGMYLGKTESRLEGWKFWDMKMPPDDQDAESLANPFVCWSKDSKLAVFGDQNGIAALIDPLAVKACKLMVHGGQSFWPIEIVSPDKIVFINQSEIGTLELDWRFGEEVKAKTEPEETKKAEEMTSAENDNKLKSESSFNWLPYAIVVIAVCLALAGYFLTK